MSKTPGKVSTATGRFGVGALIGALVGGGIGVLVALFTAGSGALHWYKAQPPEWYIVTGVCAIVFALLAVLIIAVIGVLACGLIGGVIHKYSR